jgi:excinuclease UvrABC ATPase subunit
MQTLTVDLKEVLEVAFEGKKYKWYILNDDCWWCHSLFSAHKQAKIIQNTTLQDAGLGYYQGQSSSTLLGGEAQRMLVSFLVKGATKEKKHFYLMNLQRDPPISMT